MELFETAFEYKLIYIFAINDKEHEGLLKIGDATLKTDETLDMLSPNCRILNQSAMKRIKQYTNTAGITVNLLHTELAIKSVKDKSGEIKLKAFRDYDVHRVLENSGIDKVQIKGSTSKEWFRVDLNTAVKAIDAVKKNFNNLSNSNRETIKPIIFRPEQREAIDKTIKQFKTGNRMLWNAKMRFGKTLSALQVIKEMNFKKSIIITHRPVVDYGWYEDFTKIFNGIDDYIYGSKNSGYSVEELNASGKKFVYFASMQDLRESKKVGGKYDKNALVFELNWDFVIVDEAHEGTTTALGDDVIKNVIKEDNEYDTKFLALSGTPFNILRDYDEKSIYTWDYVMEQSEKNKWYKNHFGDSNPYEELPELKIYTYDLGKIIGKESYVELEDKAFNFREFFRVWTGDIKIDGKPLPEGVEVGDFYHEKDVKSFLNLITKDDPDSNYPYAKKEYRDLFRHSLWMLPGVKEAKALSKLMKNHPVFGMGFDIVNVAGDGDDEVKSDDALKLVQNAIRHAGNKGYTITLSCGKLTTGVTVPEWTAVMMLSGSYSTSAANYLQTIFRVQSPCNIDGKIKTSSYVFDFAPDRTLKMIAESVAISTKAGKTNGNDRIILGEFLNYCPVISIDGTKMQNYDTNKLLQQLKRAYAERAVQNGFDDTNLYNDELLRLDGVALEKFEKLKGIIGSTKASYKTNDIDINRQGFSDEEYEEKERIEKKPKKERTPEEQARLDELREKNKTKSDAISILRGISIRMPLLIYGADVPISEDITIDKLTELVDDSSWEEFMPAGVSKELFNSFIKYYDPEIFVSAGRKIRNIALEADKLNPTERVIKIANLFSCFKNPDKETVLTPWRVVNMHMSQTLGGYDFFDNMHRETLDLPRFVDRGQVTRDTLENPNAKILEINSKTGLYPLYVAYSIYRTKSNITKDELSYKEEKKLWNDTIEKNVYVICKTPMAKQITKRTLIGFENTKVNAHYFDDLINQMKNKPQQLIDRVLKPSFWKKDGVKMKFDAVVGNPPYQEEIAKYVSEQNGQARRRSIFQYFQVASDELSSEAVSLIYPGARWIHRSGKGMAEFGLKQINDKNLERLDFYPDSSDIFDSVAIGDGISIVYKNKKIATEGFDYIYHKDGSEYSVHMNCPGEELIPLNPRDAMIIEKVDKFVNDNNLRWLHDRILPQKLFGIESNFVEVNSEIVRPFTSKEVLKPNEIKLFTNDKAGKAGRAKWYITQRKYIESNSDKIDEWQVVVSSANAGGQKRDNQIEIMDNRSAFGRARVALGTFKTEKEAINFYNCMNTYVIKFLFLMTDEALTSLGKKVPDFIDYTDSCKIIDFTGDLDKQLYQKIGLSKEESDYIKNRIDTLR